MSILPEKKKHQCVRKLNRLAIVGFISGILSIYPILIVFYIIIKQLLPRSPIIFLDKWFEFNPSFSTYYYFFGSFPFIVLSLIMGISALIQIRNRGKNEKGKTLATFALVFGSIGFIFLLYLTYFSACMLPFKIPWICVYY